jgi:endoglucanase
MIKNLFLFSMSVFLAAFLTSANAATWYLQNNATGDWNTLANWNSQPLGGGTAPTSISSTDNFDLNGFSVQTPRLNSGTTTFGGNTLIFHGGGAIITKTTPPATVSIPTLVSDGGGILCATPGTLGISITSLTVNANTTLNGNGSNLGLSFTIGTLSGSGDVSAIGSGGGSAGGTILFDVTTASAFTGTFFIVNGCQFTFENAVTLGGALDVEGAGTAVTLNNSVTVNGLTIGGVAKAPGTYAAATLGAPFNGTGSVIVQAAATQNFVVTQAYGINFSGGESSNRNYPTKAYYWDYYHGKALNLVRVPFSWEAVQPTLGGALNTTALAALDTAVSLAAADGMQVILDMHNYDRYSVSGTDYLVGSTQVPYSDYQGVWALLAAHFAGETSVYGYDIMNEPNGDSGTWDSTAAQYGVNGVRQGDTTHYVIVEGDSYAGAQSWMANNQTFNVTDSANKLIYSAHTYWDSNNSGVYNGSYDSNNDYPNIGVDRVAPFLYWLSLKGAVGYIGEFGVPNNVANPDYRWNNALDNFLYDINAHDVEGTYWGTYNLSQSYITRPNLDNGSTCTDAPAMAVLEEYGGGEPAAVQSPPAITSSASASAQVGESFTYQIVASNSPTSYGASGLPMGLNVNPATGLISGVPTQSGSFPVTLTATNTGGSGTAPLTLAVVVAPPPVKLPVITSAGNVTVQVGTAFSYQITASNSPASFNISGTLPGLSLNASTGLISGVATKVESFTVTMSATNAAGTGTASLTIAITAAPVPAPFIISATSAAGDVGQPFAYQITARNSPTVYRASDLPAGLSLNASGLVSGTPTESGKFVIRLSAENSSGTGTATLALTVAEPSLPIVTVSATIARVIARDGEDGVFTFTRRGGNLTHPLTVEYETEGSAVPGKDYSKLRGSKKIKVGQTSTTIRLIPLGDGAGLGETRVVTVVLKSSDTYKVGHEAKAKVKVVGD